MTALERARAEIAKASDCLAYGDSQLSDATGHLQAALDAVGERRARDRAIGEAARVIRTGVGANNLGTAEARGIAERVALALGL